MDLILWSFALQLWVLIWVDFIKTYFFGKPELHQAAAGASRGIIKTIQSKHSTVKDCFNFLYGSWLGRPLGLTNRAQVMKCRFYFGITSMKEDTSAHLSGRGELHEGARIITLIVWKMYQNLKKSDKND